MTPTLNLECSKKLYELLGEYETEWIMDAIPCDIPACNCQGVHTVRVKLEDVLPHHGFIPLPNLGEALRLLPKIGEKKGWVPYHAAILSKAQKEARGVWHPTIKWVEMHVRHCADLYAVAPSPKEGMEEVSKYLLSIL